MKDRTKQFKQMEYITKKGATLKFIRYCSGVGFAAWFQASWGPVRKHMTDVDTDDDVSPPQPAPQPALSTQSAPIKKISLFMRIWLFIKNICQHQHKA